MSSKHCQIHIYTGSGDPNRKLSPEIFRVLLQSPLTYEKIHQRKVVQEMNHLMNTLIFAFLCLLALAAAVVLWPFAVAGLVALVLSGMKFNRLVSSGVALGLVVVWRIVTGGWIFTIGDSIPDRWYFEVLPGIVSWALAAILVPGFAQWPAKFLEGYRSKLSLNQESSPKESDTQVAS